MRTCYIYNVQHVNKPSGAAATAKRIRRRLVRVVVLDPNNLSPAPRDGRRNPHGWRFANAARRRKGGELAEKMMRLRQARFPADVIANYFGTTVAAVNQRLYRMRCGRYATRAVEGRARTVGLRRTG
jgi:hypothetical protein